MSICRELLEDIVKVSGEEISRAVVVLLERSKLVVEGAGAVGVAALLAGRAGGAGPVAILLSGGNIDPTLLISVMRHGLSVAGRSASGSASEQAASDGAEDRDRAPVFLRVADEQLAAKRIRDAVHGAPTVAGAVTTALATGAAPVAWAAGPVSPARAFVAA